MTPYIFTHRGLEPSKAAYYSESSIQAFADHLKRGFSLELDLNFTKNGIVMCHDATLERLTRGCDKRALEQLTTEEAIQVELPKGHLGTYEQVLYLAKQYPTQLLALHFKGAYQTEKNIQTLLNYLKSSEAQFNQFLLFDLLPTTAQTIKQMFPTLQIAASIAHPFDIERYQIATKGTLLSLEIFLKHLDLYNWAWLDEWDLAVPKTDGTINLEGKKFYTRETFELFRKASIKIALVTPELHATSPGLIGGEAHPDAKDKHTLFTRIAEIIALRPDALCTDFPEEVRILLKATK